MFDLTRKKALITGSSQGIGFAVAKTLSDAGATVYINGSSENKAIHAAQKLKNAIPAVCDLCRSDCAEILYSITGNIDLLILNASVQFRKSWDTITEVEVDTQLTVNFKSSVKLIQKYAPAMLENRWGRIITIGSVQQKKPHKDMLIYAASKAAQLNMVQNLAKQFAPYGVTVNNVAPGVIATPRNDSALADSDYKKQVLRGIPSDLIGTPEDCSAQILLLCSEEGRYMTGEDIYIDGGMKL